MSDGKWPRVDSNTAFTASAEPPKQEVDVTWGGVVVVFTPRFVVCGGPPFVSPSPSRPRCSSTSPALKLPVHVLRCGVPDLCDFSLRPAETDHVFLDAYTEQVRQDIPPSHGLLSLTGGHADRRIYPTLRQQWTYQVFHGLRQSSHRPVRLPHAKPQAENNAVALVIHPHSGA